MNSQPKLAKSTLIMIVPFWPLCDVDFAEFGTASYNTRNILRAYFSQGEDSDSIRFVNFNKCKRIPHAAGRNIFLDKHALISIELLLIYL